jgi:2-succinyl-6-hydroxy-2,4-cyclohexadiene-1-carboxylate synthase
VPDGDRAGRSPRLAFVHGFTQTARSWDPVIARLRSRLGDDGDIVALDAPGHGERSDVDVDLLGTARLLADEVGPATWIGYSMGARLCLHVALGRPEVVDRLVLVSGTPGIEDDAERAARRAADEALATEIERIGVDAFLEQWLAQPLFASLPVDERAIEDRRRNTVAGLASSLRRCGTGTQQPLWERLGEIRVPVLVLAGELDDKYTAIARRMTPLLPDAEFVPVPGAGHAAHLERPDAVATLIADWLPDPPA